MAVCRFCGHDNAGDRVACDKCGVPLLVARRPRIDKDSQSSEQDTMSMPHRKKVEMFLGLGLSTAGLIAFTVWGIIQALDGDLNRMAISFFLAVASAGLIPITLWESKQNW